MAVSATDVQKAYLAYFGRPADPVGLAYWQTQDAATMKAGFAASTEYATMYAGMTSTQRVSQVYTNLLGRAAEPAGLLYWSGELAAGRQTVSTLVDAMQANALGADITTIANRVTYATAFTAAVDTTAEIVGYSGTTAANAARAAVLPVLDTAASLTTAQAALATSVATVTTSGASSTGSTFTLTTGVDSMTGTAGNDTFIADNSTALNNVTSAADTITGGGGVDTLKLYLRTAGGNGTILPTMSGIQNLYINNADVGVTGAGAINVSAISGLTSLEVDGHAVGTATTYTLAGQTLKLDNTALAAVDVIFSASDTTENLTLSNVVGTGASGLDISGTKVTSLSITGTGTLAAGTTNTLATLTNTGGALTTLTLSGGSALTLTENAATAAAITTINASTDTGGVTVNTSAGAKAVTFAFTGGSGIDTLTLGAADLHTITSGSQLDGGSGSSDTLAIKDAAPTAADYTALNATKNFEILGLGGANSTIDASKLTGAMATHYSVSTGTQVLSNVLNGTVVDLNGASTSVTAAPLVGQNTATFNVGTSAGTAGFISTALVTSGLATVNLVSTGSTAQTITTLTVTANSSTVLTGSDGLTVTNWVGGASGDAFDASANTGTLVLGTVGAAGAVATTVGDSGKGDVIKLGSGTSTLVMKDMGATGVGDTITLLAGHSRIDTIDATLIATAVNGTAYGSAGAQQTAMVKITNFNTGAVASDVLKIGNGTSGAVVVGNAADINTGASHVYTASNGMLSSSGVTAAQFLADIAASTAHTAGDVVAFCDGTNTYVASFDFANTALKENIIELVGVNTATALGVAAAANTIHIA